MDARRTRKIMRWVAPSILLLLLLALALAPTARAAGDGITGRVVNGTKGGPVEGQKVVLHLFANQAELGQDTATTDAHGAFTFPAPGADATSYEVTAAYRGFPYQTAELQLSSGKPAEVTLKVYEPTTDPAKVTQTGWVVWVDRESNGGAAVQQDVEWKNSGKSAYVGRQTTADGTPIVTEVPLAPGAKDFQFLYLFLESPGLTQGSTYIGTMPLVPGTSRATLRYTTDSLERLSFPVRFPTSQFQLFVPDGVTVTSGRLTAAGTTTDQGITYQVFTASDVAAGDTIDVSLSGLTGGGGSPLVFVLIGAAVIAVIGAVALWRLPRTRARRSAPQGRRTAEPRRPAARQKQEGARATTPAPRTRSAAHPKPARVVPNGDAGDGPESPNEDEAALLIDEIAALDLSYERGLLERRTYEALRTTTKNRLLRLRSGDAGERQGR